METKRLSRKREVRERPGNGVIMVKMLWHACVTEIMKPGVIMTEALCVTEILKPTFFFFVLKKFKVACSRDHF